MAADRTTGSSADHDAESPRAPDPTTEVTRVIVDDPVTTIEVIGEIDTVAAPQLRAALLDVLAAEPPTLRIDLSAVTFLDSAGINALVAARNRAADGDTAIELASVSDPARRVLEITNLIDAFTIVP